MACPAVIACSASSLRFAYPSLESLASEDLARLQTQIAHPIADIAYSLVIPENGAISVPVTYTVRTTHSEYHNYVEVFNVAAAPPQCLQCEVKSGGFLAFQDSGRYSAAGHVAA